MPLFEYQCRTCGHRFEALVTGGRQPRCPRCESDTLDKQFSTFGMGSSGGGLRSAGSGGPSCAPSGG